MSSDYLSQNYAPSFFRNMQNMGTKKLMIKILMLWFVWHTAVYCYTKFVGYVDNDAFRKYQIWVMTNGQGVLIMAVIAFFVLNNYQKLIHL